MLILANGVTARPLGPGELRAHAYGYSKSPTCVKIKKGKTYHISNILQFLIKGFISIMGHVIITLLS